MKSFLIIGMSKFGYHLCRELSKDGCEIMIADKSEEKMSELLDCVIDAKIADCTKIDVLRSLGVCNFDACIVCMSENFQSSLEITSLLKELGVKKVISVAATDIQANLLYRLGANEVIYPEHDIASKMAVVYSNDTIYDYISMKGEYSFFEISTPKKWVGEKINEINVRAKHNISVVAIKKENGETYMPDGKYQFNEKEHLVVICKREDLKKIIK